MASGLIFCVEFKLLLVGLGPSGLVVHILFNYYVKAKGYVRAADLTVYVRSNAPIHCFIASLYLYFLYTCI